MENKNKITISIFVAVCIIGTIVGYSLIKQHENNKYDQLAVMTQQDDGTYITSNMSAFGNDDYEFDHAVCNNGSTVIANSNGGVNLKLLGTDKCTVYLNKINLIDIQAIKDSARPSVGLDYSVVEGNTLESVTDDNFNKSEQIYTVDVTHQSYYMTYAETYTLNAPTYTLTDPQVGKYSDIYGSLAGKYIVNYEGHNSETAAKSATIDRIYKVVSATADSITYIPSSYTAHFTNSTTGVYTVEDDYGTSYYFRGNVTNNYVKFGKWTEEVYRGYSADQSEYKEYFTKAECQADATRNYGCNKSPVAGKNMYWRIVRINGDNTLRLMYDGTEAYSNGTRSLDRFAIQYQKYNNATNNNAYVGYMYGDINGTTYGAVHANTNNSAMKAAIDTWYEKNFKDTTYASKISDTIFCNDRSLISGTGIGTEATQYGASNRLVTQKEPSLVCSQQHDAFTVNDTEKGNGDLAYPVGLLTADEVALAGGVYGSNNKGYYMGKGYAMWLGSPYRGAGGAVVFAVNTNGNLYVTRPMATYRAAPVINLSAEAAIQLKGSGTMDNPYHF